MQDFNILFTLWIFRGRREDLTSAITVLKLNCIQHSASPLGVTDQKNGQINMEIFFILKAESAKLHEIQQTLCCHYPFSRKLF